MTEAFIETMTLECLQNEVRLDSDSVHVCPAQTFQCTETTQSVRKLSRQVREEE